jgi:hypothetical protein
MPLETFFVLAVERCSFREFNHYPSNKEIEAEITRIFPTGSVFDQGKEIPIKAHVEKFYRLSKEANK